MKKSKCLICGGIINIQEEINICPHCNNEINYDVISKTNKIETLKHDALMYIINNEFNKLLIFVDNNYNNLLLEYYRMYSFISLNKEYDKNKFFNTNLSYKQEELETIINHMIEHQYMFSKEDILFMINKSNKKDKYNRILNKEINEKIKEKELREKLFSLTNIPETKEIDTNQQEGKSYLIIGSLIYISFVLLIFIFTKKDLKYSLFNLSCIIPSIILARGLVKLIGIKQAKLIIGILFFIGLIYILSLPGLVFTKDYNILTHVIGIVKSPIEFFTALAEGMKSYEK